MQTGKSVTPEGYSRDRFNLYNEDGSLAYANVTFEHATGWCFRAQPFGVEPEYNVFVVQQSLRAFGYCHVGGHTAIAGTLTLGTMRTLAHAEEARRLVRSAGHFE